jgi:hypothetical protein
MIAAMRVVTKVGVVEVYWSMVAAMRVVTKVGVVEVYQ